MLYRHARETIRNGDLLFVRGAWFYSRVIQRLTRSVYSHCGVALWIRTETRDRLCVVEAMEGRGVDVVPVSRKLDRGEAIDWYQLADRTIDRERVVAWALDKWGLRYASPRQLLRSFVTAPLCAWLDLPTRVDRDRWFCSWFAAEALSAGGWRPPADDAIAPERAAPGDVALFPCLRRRGPLTWET